jgi:type II secretory pathway component PulJ
VTLAELLVSIAVLGLLLAGTFAALDEGQRALAYGAARVEAQQSARVGLERMAREIRQAGRGPLPPGFDPIAVAEPSRLTLHLDLDGDGVIAPTRETVTWLLAGGVLRRNAGGGAQPIVNGARDLVFVYFDADGRPAAAAADVRAVGIRLTTGPHVARGAVAGRVATTFSTRVRLRNR